MLFLVLSWALMGKVARMAPRLEYALLQLHLLSVALGRGQLTTIERDMAKEFSRYRPWASDKEIALRFVKAALSS